MSERNTSSGPNKLPPEVAEKIGPYYVYALADPCRHNELFYVGKGTGERFQNHLDDARRAFESADPKAPEKIARINMIQAQGMPPTVFIIHRGLTKDEAFRLEAILIKTIPNLTNKIAGHHEDRYKVELRDLVEELGAPDLTRTPAVPALLVFLQGWVDERDEDLDRAGYGYPSRDEFPQDNEWERALRDATRGKWLVDRDKADALRYVVAVHQGVTRAVYSIRAGSWKWRADERKPRRLRGYFDVDDVPRNGPVWQECVGELGRRLKDRNYGSSFRYWPPRPEHDS